MNREASLVWLRFFASLRMTSFAGGAGGRDVKKIKNQKAKIKDVEPLRGGFFAVVS